MTTSESALLAKDDSYSPALEWIRLFEHVQGPLVAAKSESSLRGAGRSHADVRSIASTISTSQKPARKAASASADPLLTIRKMVITTPLPPETALTSSGSTYRSIIWKLFLDIRTLPVSDYLCLVDKGESAAHEKIRNDTFRTLATDPGFQERVGEDKLIRLLDAFVWKHDQITTQSPRTTCESSIYDFNYVQGMNVLAAPFLYTLGSEVEAFYCFSRFIEYCCPLYVQPTLSGVHRGVQLLDKCLKLLDEPLYSYLRDKNLSAEIYAFPSVMTLCACTPPLSEVLQLWDFLLAFGVHFNVLCIAAQLHIMRNDLLQHASPMTLLRNLPPLDARRIISVTVTFAKDIPETLYEELVRHPYHPDTTSNTG